jgi:hypothetical protein
MDNLEYTVSRSEVQSFFSRDFTDQEWQVLVSEINNIFYHYLWTDLPAIVDDLPNLLEE